MSEPSLTKPPAARWGRRLLLALLLVAGLFAGGMLVGAWAGQSAGAERPAGAGGLAGLLGLPAAMLIVIAAHEGGHLLGGKLVGFRFVLLIIGPLKVTAGRTGLQFGLNRSLALAGGLAACAPSDTHRLYSRMAVMVAGGPLASVLLGAGALWAGRLLAGQAPWAMLAGQLGVLSLAIAAVTLVPFTTSGFLTDGAQLLSLLRHDAAARQRALMLALQSESYSGTRPRAWSRSLLTALLAERAAPTFRGLAQLLAYYVALDEGDLTAADDYLAQILSGAAQPAQVLAEATYLEAAYFYAAHHHDAAAARRYLTQSAGSLAEPHTRLRAEAAVLLAEGNHAAGRAKAAEAVRLAARSVDQGSAAAEQAWIKRDLLGGA